MSTPRCPDCGAILTTFCPACRGRKGGQAKTARKAVASKLTAIKAGKRRRSNRKRPK
jgi:uncharacterized Zn finger protein (UPF0148 family)